MLAWHASPVEHALWFALASGACLLAALSRGRACSAALLAACVMLGAGWWTIRIGSRDGPERSQDVPPGMVTIEGVLLERPRDASASGLPFRTTDTTSLRLAAHAVIMPDGSARSVRGLVIARVTGVRRHMWHAGDRLRIRGMLEPPRAPMNPGEPDPRPRAAQDGFLGRLQSTPTLVNTLGPEPGLHAGLFRWRHTLRERALAAFSSRTDQAADARGLALCRSLLLGEDDRSLDETREAFTRVGLSHVLAISGFHLVVMVWTLTRATRLLGDRGSLESWLVALLILLYLLIVPAEAPIIRAGAMSLAFLLADALGRRHDPLALLGWIGVALAIWRPADVLSLGAQLSIGLTAALIWLGARVNSRVWGVRLKGGIVTPDPTLASMLRDQAKSLVSASLLCWIVAVPLIAWRTGSVSVLALPATLAVVPACVALMWIGFVALLLGMAWPEAGQSLTPAIDALGSLVADLALWFDESPLSLVRVPAFSLAHAAAGTGLAIWWCVSGRWRSSPHWIATALVVAWGAIELRQSSSLPAHTLLRIDTLAVDDGTCHLVRSGGETLIWDCGSLARADIGKRTLPRAARALGVSRAPVAVLTHPNLDHYNGLVDASRILGIRTLLVGQATVDDAALDPAGPVARLLRELQQAGVALRLVRAGDSFDLGEVTVEFLWPGVDAFSGPSNDRSLVAVLRPRHTGDGELGDLALLTGDVQPLAIRAIAADHPTLSPRLLELPHHGSYTRESDLWVARLDPAVVHQSTGPSRAGDPRWALRRAERTWRTTATDGAHWTELLWDGNARSGTFRSERSAHQRVSSERE